MKHFTQKRWLKIIGIGILFLMLTLIRYFEDLFYDPLKSYFEYDYLHTTLPELNKAKLFLNIFIRYALNSIISIIVIWVAFKKKSYIVFSSYFYVIAFFILIISLWLALLTQFEHYYLFGFYVRRFLIHPIFVLVLLPAFYYQYRISKSN